jgi:peptidoglycan/LPS O-acetylase OafA/YrhL
MGARRSMPSTARKRYYQRRIRRLGVLLTVSFVLAAVICSSLVYPVLAPDSDLGVSIANISTPEPFEPEKQKRPR